MQPNKWPRMRNNITKTFMPYNLNPKLEMLPSTSDGIVDGTKDENDVESFTKLIMMT